MAPEAEVDLTPAERRELALLARVHAGRGRRAWSVVAVVFGVLFLGGLVVMAWAQAGDVDEVLGLPVGETGPLVWFIWGFLAAFTLNLFVQTQRNRVYASLFAKLGVLPGSRA